jgi:hypothetical protein
MNATIGSRDPLGRAGMLMCIAALAALSIVLPAVLDRCREFLVVAECRERGHHLLLRAMFLPTSSGRRVPAPRSSPRLLAVLDEALAVAQRLAPHDTLAIQRALLRRMLPRGADQ